MRRFTSFTSVLVALILALNITASWGQVVPNAAGPVPAICSSPGCNPTVSSANGNTAGGTGALANAGTSGFGGNTAFGAGALFSNTTSYRSTAVGTDALQSNDTGHSNVAIGAFALRSNSSGIRNTASGMEALHNNTTGNQNTASGADALLGNTTGNSNTACGSEALFGNGTGNLNTAAGFQALGNNFAGSNNTAVGAKALRKVNGTKNIGIGYQAGVTLGTGNNNIYIGNQGAGDESQTIRIGTAQAQTFIAGIGNASVSGATVEVDTETGQLGIVTSSVRYKEDIAPMGSRSEKVLELRPVTFAYKDDARKVTRYGLLAEEVAAVYPDLVARTATGEVQSVRYHELIPMLINELQREHQEVAMLRKELAELRAVVGMPSRQSNGSTEKGGE